MGTLHPAEYNVPVPEVVIGEGLAVDALADHELEQMGARRTSLGDEVPVSIPVGAGRAVAWYRRSAGCLVPTEGAIRSPGAARTQGSDPGPPGE